MKKKVWFFIIIVVTIMSLYLLWFTFPQKYSVILHGISYQTSNEVDVKVTIHIDGEMKKSISGLKTFKGSFLIEGDDIPIPTKNRNVMILFNHDGIGIIVYAGYDNGNPYTYGYGTIFINNDFSKLCILKNGSDNYQSIIAAPAETRTDAIAASKKLMKDYLTNIASYSK